MLGSFNFHYSVQFSSSPRKVAAPHAKKKVPSHLLLIRFLFHVLQLVYRLQRFVRQTGSHPTHQLLIKLPAIKVAFEAMFRHFRELELARSSELDILNTGRASAPPSTINIQHISSQPTRAASARSLSTSTSPGVACARALRIPLAWLFLHSLGAFGLL